MTCRKYETMNGIECIHYREEIYSVGVSRYCRLYDRDVYELKDQECFHRGTYSNEVQSSEVNRTPKARA